MDNLIVETFYGKVKGVKDKDIDNNEFYSFKGIPYAKPPINELRFQVRLNYPLNFIIFHQIKPVIHYIK